MNTARFSRLALAGTLLFLLGASRPACAQNIVQDPSFETPALSGPTHTYYAGAAFGPWTVNSGSVDLTGNWQAADGNQSVDMSGYGAGTLYQDLHTTSGQSYDLTFSLAGNPDSPGVKSLSVFWRGVEVPGSPFTFDSTGKTRQNLGYIDVSVPGLDAASSLTRLKFQSNTHSAYGPVIDNVRVTLAASPPILNAIQPSQQPAGAPAFTLNAFGSLFEPNAEIEWNDSPLSTTHVSATQLSASVPASLIASAGVAHVIVVNPNTGAVSDQLPFTVTVTRVTPTFDMLSRDGSGVYHQIVTLQNTGYANAPNLKATLGVLGSAHTTTALPLSFGTLAANQSVSFTLAFPASAGTPGSTVNLHVSGTYTGGTWSKAVAVTLP